MLVFILRRVTGFVPNVLILTLLLFCGLTGWLGSPAALMLGNEATAEAIADLNAAYGFDDPLLTQYGRWLLGALQGDFGRSFSTQQRVSQMLLDALPVSIELGILAIGMAFVGAVVLNSLVSRGDALGLAISGLSVVGITVPTFMLGACLIFVFGIKLQWLPTSGWPAWEGGAAEHLRHAVLPVITLAAYYFAAFSMIYRAEYARVSNQLFVRVARAKGLGPGKVSFRHVLPNAVLPIVTYVGLSLGHVMGGAVMTEAVFTLPGLGRVFVQAIRANDYPVILAVGMVVLAAMMIANLLADILLALCNPQVRIAS